MPNYSLNNDAPEPDRSLEDNGFRGLGVTNPATTYASEALGVPPNQVPHPLVNEISESSDTQKTELGPAAGDFARRGY
jgi:hypothetical protein